MIEGDITREVVELAIEKFLSAFDNPMFCYSGAYRTHFVGDWRAQMTECGLEIRGDVTLYEAANAETTDAPLWEDTLCNSCLEKWL